MCVTVCAQLKAASERHGRLGRLVMEELENGMPVVVMYMYSVVLCIYRAVVWNHDTNTMSSLHAFMVSNIAINVKNSKKGVAVNIRRMNYPIPIY